MCLGSRRPLVRDPSIISGGQKVQRIPVRNLKAASLSIIILPDWKVQHDTLRFQTSDILWRHKREPPQSLGGR